MAQLAERLDFDLANALSGNGKALPDFFQGVFVFQLDPKPHAHDLLFTRSQGMQGPDHLVFSIDKNPALE